MQLLIHTVSSETTPRLFQAGSKLAFAQFILPTLVLDNRLVFSCFKSCFKDCYYRNDERSTRPKRKKHEGFRWHWIVTKPYLPLFRV